MNGRGWKIPIEIMLDMNTLRKHVPVITTAEYLSLHGLPISLERDDGRWDPELYHQTPHRPPPSPPSHPPLDSYDGRKTRGDKDEREKRKGADILPPPTLAVIKNEEYDSESIARVDRLPSSLSSSSLIPSPQSPEYKTYQDLLTLVNRQRGRNYILLGQVFDYFRDKKGEDWGRFGEKELKRRLSALGLGLVWTYEGL